MSFADFLHSAAARRIAPLIDDPAMLTRMEELSRAGVPAIGALDQALAGSIALSNTEKQHVGRWVKEVLAARGWRPKIQRRLAPGQVFTSGMVYSRHSTEPNRPTLTAQPDELPTELLSVRERVKAAQAMVRQLGGNTYGVEDFLHDKYAEAAHEDRKMAE